MVYLLKTICCQEMSKIAQSGHTGHHHQLTEIWHHKSQSEWMKWGYLSSEAGMVEVMVGLGIKDEYVKAICCTHSDDR